MKGKRFSEEQIIAVLMEVEAGTKVMDVCKKYNISAATYYNWEMSKYYSTDVSELKRIKQLEDENRKLKQLVADHALDIQGLKHIISKSTNARGATQYGQ